MRAMVLITLLILIVFSPCMAQNGISALTVRPMDFQRLPLDLALGQLGFEARGGYVTFGIEIRQANSEVELGSQESTTFSDALDHILSQLQGYTYQVVSDHLINVYPSTSKSNPTNLLNLHVAKFEVKDIPAGDIFSNPQRFIPELATELQKSRLAGCSIGPGLGSTGPGVTLSLQNVTVREILNAVAVADLNVERKGDLDPLGWVVSVHQDSTGGQLYSWSFISSVPRRWRTYSAVDK